MISRMWTGSVCGSRSYTGRALVSDSIIHYLPIILGDRLPRHIVDKIADDYPLRASFYVNTA